MSLPLLPFGGSGRPLLFGTSFPWGSCTAHIIAKPMAMESCCIFQHIAAKQVVVVTWQQCNAFGPMYGQSKAPAHGAMAVLPVN
eukprot:scaffold23070_cov22-Tisochrysis_lutea.AAC.1